MADLNEMYRAEGWGNVTDQALGIPPENVESQARMVASWAHTELSQLKALNAELRAALLEIKDYNIDPESALGAAITLQAMADIALDEAESEAQS